MAPPVIMIRSFDEAGRAAYPELAERLQTHATVRLPPRAPGPPRYLGEELIIALGSAGAFTAVYQIIKAYLERHRTAEVSITYGDKHVSFKAYSAPDARTLIREVFPGAPEEP